jgi:hypothetical protein
MGAQALGTSAEHALQLLPRLTWNQRSRSEEGLKLFAQASQEMRSVFGGRSLWPVLSTAAPASAASASAPSQPAADASAQPPELNPLVQARSTEWARLMFYSE